MKTLKFTVIAVIFAVLLFGTSYAASDFYLGTDKTFDISEIPYVNLDGPSGVDYDFRVYRIDDPVSFFSSSVFDRLIREENSEVYADTVSLTVNAWERFKAGFRQTARKELNTHTRSHVSSIAGVTYDKHVRDEALPGYLKQYSLLSHFPVPASEMKWAYRRVPVPVATGPGVFLVEAVHDNHIGYTLIVKTRISFITKQSDGETLVFAAKRDTGEAVAGARILIRDEQAKTFAVSGVTDQKGVFYLKKTSSSKSLILLNHKDGFAISDPSFFSSSFYGKGGLRTYIYTDRPVYRPGDSICFKGIVRNHTRGDYEKVAGAGSVSVINPKGDTIIENMPVTISDHMGTFDGFLTLPDGSSASLGNYQLVFHFNEETFATEFMVDAYKKPHYIVKVNTENVVHMKNKDVRVTVTGRYHYGVPVDGAEVKCRVFRKPVFDYSPVGALPFFMDSADYLGLMKNPGANILVSEEKGTLDENGTFSFNVKPDINADQDYTYTVIATVTADDRAIDGTGAFSVNRSDFFIKLTKESSVYKPGDSISVRTALRLYDASLPPEEILKRLKDVKIEGSVFTRGFTAISSEDAREKIYGATLTANEKGEAVFSFKAERKGHYILEFKAKDKNGEETSSQTALWVSEENGSVQTVLKNLSVTAGKDVYTEGEKAEFLIVSPVSNGRILVTLENDRIVKYDIIELKGNACIYKTRISKELSPNFNVSAVQIVNNDIYRNQIKVAAPPAERLLNVGITTDKAVYSPGETVKAVIETKNSKGEGVSSDVSLAMVDRAVFQIQEDRNPSISLFFYHPRPNNVITTYSTAYRFFGYSEEKRLQLALRSRPVPPLAAMKDISGTERKIFKDTGYWAASLKTDAHGRAQVNIVLPDNIATWRLSAVAVTEKTQVGQIRKEFVSRKELMVNPAMPAYLIKGVKQDVAATLTNLTKEPFHGPVKISMTAGAIDGPNEKVVTVPAGKSVQVRFKVMAEKNDPSGNADILLAASGGRLKDSVHVNVPLKQNGIETRDTASVFAYETGVKKKLELVMPKHFTPKKSYLLVTQGISAALDQSLSYLAGYPYGCIEQTMSRFMPVLAVKQSGTINGTLSAQLPDMTSKGLALIRSHQLADGSFPWYGGDNGDVMMTAYVLRGLGLCEKLGAGTTGDMKNRASRYLYDRISGGKLSVFEKNYILFAMAESGLLEHSMTDNLMESVKKQGAYTKSLAGLVLLSINRKAEASKLLEEIISDNSWMKDADYELTDDSSEKWETDRIEAVSSVLLLAVRLGAQDTLIQSLSRILITNRTGEAWKNSRDSAMAVLALTEALKQERITGKGFSFDLSENGGPSRRINLTEADINSGKTRIPLDEKALKPGKNKLVLTPVAGSASLAAIAEFIDFSERFKPVSRGARIERNYYNITSGNHQKKSFFSSKTSETFKTGDLVMVELTIRKIPKKDDYFVVEDPLPAGMSVIRDDGVYYSEENKKIYTDKQSFDDRTALFCKNVKKGDRVIYFLRAELPGTYRTMPAKLQSMYYPSVYATTNDTHITVNDKVNP